jgi:hypothetical protein
VPPLSQFVKDVPAALEHIMGQALARDPRSRYQTARDFGRDLNRVLFQLGRPVSSFDIGSLVSDVREEQRRQRGARPKQQTLIGSLIQDAMMTFSSLQSEEDDESSLNSAPEEQSGVGAIPLSFGTFEGSHSGARAPSAEPSQVSFAPSEASYNTGTYEAGNLAALEEDPTSAPQQVSQLSQRPRTGAPRPPQQHYDPAVLRPGHPQSRPIHEPIPYPTQPLAPAAPPSPGKLPVTFWVITATLVAAGAAVGAYLAGIFS